jgi:hypothetical protein
MMLGEATSDLTATSILLQDPDGRILPGTPVDPAHLQVSIPGCTLVSVLGQGGMGVVFLARQERLDRFVAVKMLATDAGRDAIYLARLEREAQTLATLSHPNIVGCHDILSTEQGTFLIMQFVPGQLSVRDLLLRFGKLPEVVVARIALDTARGLAYAHKKGICHRDVKPDNLLVYREDSSPPHAAEDVFRAANARVMICDFGIAREAVPAEGGLDSVLGSPAYMAPEQAFDRGHIDFRADIYALGSTLYQLLTGKRPFVGSVGIETVRLKLAADLPDPRTTGTTASDECVHILKCMGQRDPQERYASYVDLLADLESWFHQQQRTQHRRILGRYPPAFWKGLVAGASAVLLIGGVVAAVKLRDIFEPLPPSCAATLGYWSGDRSSWRVTEPDAETHGPSLLGLSPDAPLELRQSLEPNSRARFKVRVPGPGQVRCALRQEGRERWWLRWQRRNGSSVFASEADGRDIPLVEIPDRKSLDWLSVDLRVREREIDLLIDGKLRGIAPLKEALGKAHLVIEIREGSLAQFTDIWITDLH